MRFPALEYHEKSRYCVNIIDGKSIIKPIFMNESNIMKSPSFLSIELKKDTDLIYKKYEMKNESIYINNIENDINIEINSENNLSKYRDSTKNENDLNCETHIKSHNCEYKVKYDVSNKEFFCEMESDLKTKSKHDINDFETKCELEIQNICKFEDDLENNENYQQIKTDAKLLNSESSLCTEQNNFNLKTGIDDLREINTDSNIKNENLQKDEQTDIKLDFVKKMITQKLEKEITMNQECSKKTKMKNFKIYFRSPYTIPRYDRLTKKRHGKKSLNKDEVHKASESRFFYSPSTESEVDREYEYIGEKIIYRGLPRNYVKVKWYLDPKFYCPESEVNINLVTKDRKSFYYQNILECIRAVQKFKKHKKIKKRRLKYVVIKNR